MNNLISKSIIILLLLTNNSFAIFSKNKLPATPVSMQIDLSKKGNKAEIDLRIETKEEKEYLEPESTAFELQFIPYDPRYDKNSKYYLGFWRRNFYDIGMLRKYFREYTKEEKDVKHNGELKFIDLFCGIGGFHQVLKNLGCKCILACDNDKSCQEVYKINYNINLNYYYVFFLVTYNIF